MALRLRDYIYLDADLVGRLLSQVEGGVADEEERTDVEKVAKRRGAGIKAAPASAELGRTTDRETTASRTVRQTADSACGRLIDSLEASESLNFLESPDGEPWRELRRGEPFEVDATLGLSAIAQIGGLVEAFKPLLAVMRSAGQEVEDAEELEQVMEAFSGLTGLMKAVPALACPSGAPDYSFIASLKHESLRVDQDQLSGEATVFGTLQRRLRSDETWTIFDAIGLAGLPRSIRRKIEQNMSESDDPDLEGMVVRPPAAIINTIAIYR